MTLMIVAKRLPDAAGSETGPNAEESYMEQIRQLLPFLIPILLLEAVLIVVALIDLARRERTRGPKWLWVLVILFVSLLGPIIYFAVGRQEE